MNIRVASLSHDESRAEKAMPEIEGRQYLLKGRVQGVGFRPFVHRLATALNMTGQAQNLGGHLQITAWGNAQQHANFERAMVEQAPPSSLIQDCEVIPLPASNESTSPATEFKILFADNPDLASCFQANAISPDRRLCNACLNELLDKNDRRYRYPFINCVDCGPRWSSLLQLPYERHHTSWAPFSLCSPCTQEYQGLGHESFDRRFHAEGISCSDCGPAYRLYSRDAVQIDSANSDPFHAAASALKAGMVVALKGVSGFHLLCDANNPAAIERLRANKHRPHKPLAIMGLNAPSLSDWIHLSDLALNQLDADAAPIVVCPIRQEGKRLNDTNRRLLIPGLDQMGVMMPYCPAHYLLFHALLGEPEGTDWLKNQTLEKLVVTSANMSGEPLIYDSTGNEAKLLALADLVLDHNLPIQNPTDDAVMMEATSPLRLGRGVCPLSSSASNHRPSVLALGAHLKNSLCLAAAETMHLSAPLGSLSTPEALTRLHQSIENHERLFNLSVEAIACDDHPDYASTRIAQLLSEQRKLPLIRVQHHRAHVAAVMAEHDLEAPVLGLVLDGTGYGDQGEIWGAELFAGTATDLEHVSRFKPIALPGGDIATKEVWRLGLANTMQFDEDKTEAFICRLPENVQLKARSVMQLGLCDAAHQQVPKTSSAGRYFDAAASLLGICQETSYEAQAAMELEALAQSLGDEAFSQALKKSQQLVGIDANGDLNLDPLMASLMTMTDPATGALRFHAELVHGLKTWLIKHAEQHRYTSIVCGGGCFQNRLLTRGLKQLFKDTSHTLLFPENIPANDAAIAVGQAWIARAVLQDRPSGAKP